MALKKKKKNKFQIIKVEFLKESDLKTLFLLLFNNIYYQVTILLSI